MLRQRRPAPLAGPLPYSIGTPAVQLAAADGGVVAQVCGTDLVVIGTGTTQRRTQPSPAPAVDTRVVDAAAP